MIKPRMVIILAALAIVAGGGASTHFGSSKDETAAQIAPGSVSALAPASGKPQLPKPQQSARVEHSAPFAASFTPACDGKKPVVLVHVENRTDKQLKFRLQREHKDYDGTHHFLRPGEKIDTLTMAFTGDHSALFSVVSSHGFTIKYTKPKPNC